MANRSHAPIPTRPARSHASAGLLATLSALEVRAATAESERAGTSIRAHSRAGLRADRSRTTDLRSRSPQTFDTNLGVQFHPVLTQNAGAAVAERAVLIAARRGVVGGAAAAAALRQATSPRTQQLETIFEAQSQLFANPAAALDQLQQLGVDDVKVFMPWGSMAPDPVSHTRPPSSTPPHRPRTRRRYGRRYDAIVRAAAARGMGVDLALEAPAAAVGDRTGGPARHLARLRRGLGALGQGVRAVREGGGNAVRRPLQAAGQTTPLPPVRFWSIWNEPNYGQQLAPQAIDNSTVEVSPMLYRQLLDAAWTAFEQTGHGERQDPDRRGGSARRDDRRASGQLLRDGAAALHSRAVLRGPARCIRCRGRPRRCEAARRRPPGRRRSRAEHPGLFHATGFAVHPYPQGQVTPDTATPNEPDYADLPKLASLEATLDGASGGIRVEHPTPDLRHRVRLSDQPAGDDRRARSVPRWPPYYMNWAEYISWRNPRIASWDQYLLTDPPPPSNFDTGLEFAERHAEEPDVRRVPAAAVSAVSHGQEGPPIEVWGEVRPAHHVMLHRTGRRWRRSSSSPRAVGLEDRRASHDHRQLRVLRHHRDVPVHRLGADRPGPIHGDRC